MTASCDTCRRPGSCCSGFVIAALGAFHRENWREDSQRELRQRAPMTAANLEPMNCMLVLSQPDMVQPTWRCTKLGPDGRCTDYENRPFMCREYKPGEDALCVEHVTTFKGVPLTSSTL